MGKTQYPQKFRDEWLVESIFKDWLLKIEDNDTKTCNLLVDFARLK